MPTPSEIQTCINNLTTSSQAIDFTLLAAETSNSGTGISFSVPTVNDLPDLETTNVGSGQIVFVESIGVPVVSTENEWKGLDGRLLRRDFMINAIFSWGSNDCGRLGDGTITNRCSPVREFCYAKDWCQVNAGSYNTAAIKTSGQLWTWGRNICGQLGDGTINDKCSPVREFCSATDWCQVSAGNSQTAAVKTSGQLWVWGYNRCGALGDGTTVSKCSPVREICSATDWCGVSVGSLRATAIKTSGQLWVWGLNSSGQLGDGTTVSKCSPVREFCSGTDWSNITNSSAIKTSGQLWVWGFNVGGHAGDGTTVDKCSPVREFCSATDWCQVSRGSGNTSAIKTNGQLWSWGFNNGGWLGDGTTTNRCSPVREICSATNWCQVSREIIGTSHAAALKTSGELWAWGSNGGRLGDGTTTDRCSPVREFCSATDWCQVTVGSCCYTAAIRVMS